MNTDNSWLLDLPLDFDAGAEDTTAEDVEFGVGDSVDCYRTNERGIPVACTQNRLVLHLDSDECVVRVNGMAGLFDSRTGWHKTDPCLQIRYSWFN